MSAYDAIVVGAGASGGWCAMDLAQADLRVLVLEAGPAEPRAPQTGRQPIQSRCYAYSRATRRLFVDDSSNPYETPKGLPFTWIRGRQVGGKTRLWGGVSRRLRESELAGWPVTLEELAPHYRRVERALGVRNGRAEPSRAGEPLRKALATGRVTLRAGAIVRRVLLSRGRARGVAFLDARTGRETVATAAVVLLCASPIESARLLLLSGLEDPSGQLGRGLSDHPMVAVGGGVKGRGRSGSARIPMPGFNLDVDVSGGRFRMTAFLGQRRDPANRVTLGARRDAWGIPVARIASRYGRRERTQTKAAIESMLGMVEASGWTVTGIFGLQTPGTSVHESGTARMGRDSRRSVLDPFQRCWKAPNLYVADASCFPSGGIQNPTLTVLALASRCCRHILSCARSR